MESRSEAEALRRAFGRLGPRGRGRRYPAELRSRTMAYVGKRRAEGATTKSIEGELGVTWTTLARWSSTDAEPGFAHVVVHADAGRKPDGDCLIVYGPAGLRIEGLNLDALAELLRRLA